MNTILIKPTDTTDPDYNRDLATYEGALESVLIEASPDIRMPITKDEVPFTYIDRPIFVLPAEQQVLTDKAMTAADVAALDKTGMDYQLLLVLVEIQLAKQLIPHLPQLLEASAIQQRSRYAESDWEKVVAAVDKKYETTLTPTPTSTPSSDFGSATVLLTDSRLT